MADRTHPTEGETPRDTPRPTREEIAHEQPPDRDGGSWVGSHLLSELMVATAQAKCAGLDWFANDAGYGWVWIPGDELNALQAIGDEVLNRQLRASKVGG